MTMSRSSSASEGEVLDTRHKANTVNSRNEPAINGSNRSFGLDGAYDNYRALSRSPSPYRRKRTPSRSPSPYRKSRAVDRSPSPYRRSRADQAGSDSRGYKRKASPPRSRPDKRYHADRSRHGDPRRAPAPKQASFVKERKDVPDRSHAKPISYAEVENPNPVPDFREPLPTDKRHQNAHYGDQQREKSRQAQQQNGQARLEGSKSQAQQASVAEDVEM
jgi:serine/threonine-protein kinase PRP4